MTIRAAQRARRREHARIEHSILGVRTYRLPAPSRQPITLTVVLFAVGPRDEGRYVAHVAATHSPLWTVRHGQPVSHAVAASVFAGEIDRARYREPADGSAFGAHPVLAYSVESRPNGNKWRDGPHSGPGSRDSDDPDDDDPNA